MFKVTASIKDSAAQALISKFKGAGWDRFLRRQADTMAAQARTNISEMGRPSGPWPKLSGWNQGGQVTAKARIKQNKNRLTKEQQAMVRDGVIANPYALSDGRDAALAKSGRRHAGYAGQKEREYAEGKIRFGPDVRLRRTGGLAESLTGKIDKIPTGAKITLIAVGNIDGDTTYQQLLEWHAEGTPRMPQRNPASDMSKFEARLAEDLRSFLGVGNGRPGGGRQG